MRPKRWCGSAFGSSGWSRSAEAASTASNAFTARRSSTRSCARTDILVCLLPLTPDTRHILNRELFAKLNRASPMGAPVLINAGRGGLQNEADILPCLDDGTLGAVSLDVYATEPLPPDSPFWTHPKVVLTPHNAADTDPDEISKYVARQIERFEAGGELGKSSSIAARGIERRPRHADDRFRTDFRSSPGTSAGRGPGAAQ